MTLPLDPEHLATVRHLRTMLEQLDAHGWVLSARLSNARLIKALAAVEQACSPDEGAALPPPVPTKRRALQRAHKRRSRRTG